MAELEQTLETSPTLYIDAKEGADMKITFTLKNTNVSIANALRRTLLSDIPTLTFKTFPHSENLAIIHKNTSRFNNEIIKHRLGCIPIYIKNIDSCKNLVLEPTANFDRSFEPWIIPVTLFPVKFLYTSVTNVILSAPIALFKFS